VRAEPAAVRQRLVGLVHRVAREPEAGGQLAAGRQALARQQPAGFDQPAQMGLQLEIERRALGIGLEGELEHAPRLKDPIRS
jgi:hypothetical protein